MTSKVSDVRMGIRRAQTELFVQGVDVEVGTHQRKLFVDRVVIDYASYPEVGYWRWETVTAHGTFGSGKEGSKAWDRGVNLDIPHWIIVLVYGYVPEHREVKR